MTMASPSFRSPEAAPVGASSVPAQRAVTGGCPPARNAKAELRKFRGFSHANGP